jgi:type I phosphodiesterase/nucleotide pyrophosphatase
MIDLYQLGQREETDVLAVSFSALDIVGHAYGPESREIEDALIRLDETIGTLIENSTPTSDASITSWRSRATMAWQRSRKLWVPPARIATDDIRERIEETLVRQFGGRSLAPITLPM